MSGQGHIKLSDISLSQTVENIKLKNGIFLFMWFKIDSLTHNNRCCKIPLIYIKNDNGQRIQINIVNNEIFFLNHSEREKIFTIGKNWSFLALNIKPKTFLKSPECFVKLFKLNFLSYT
jgi:hypothetical protein